VSEPSFALAGPNLGPAEFQRIAQLVYDRAGIQLPVGKEGLVRSRLAKRLRSLGLDDFAPYVQRVTSGEDPAETAAMLDALTTNKTSWWREKQHFDLLETIAPAMLEERRPLTIWSAGCSTGEEPYTIAMVLAMTLGDRGAAQTRVLATDLSTRVLERAKKARYDAEEMDGVPREALGTYFTKAHEGTRDVCDVVPAIRRTINFAQLNLMGPWPMKGPFDVIFCRNVMIYFDKQTQGKLIERYWGLLRPGGYLFIGHSESLTGLAHRFTYQAPAVYRK
jgi:chemotaxis protein methyltransferase CheR